MQNESPPTKRRPVIKGPDVRDKQPPLPPPVAPTPHPSPEPPQSLRRACPKPPSILKPVRPAPRLPLPPVLHAFIPLAACPSLLPSLVFPDSLLSRIAPCAPISIAPHSALSLPTVRLVFVSCSLGSSSSEDPSGGFPSSWEGGSFYFFCLRSPSLGGGVVLVVGEDHLGEPQLRGRGGEFNGSFICGAFFLSWERGCCDLR